MRGWSILVARQAHNLTVIGFQPDPRNRLAICRITTLPPIMRLEVYTY